MTRWTGIGAHRTRTIAWDGGRRYKTKSNGSCGRWVTVEYAKAECVCGWSRYAGDRPEAQAAARSHRRMLTVATADLRRLTEAADRAAVSPELRAALDRLHTALQACGEADAAEVAAVDLRPILHAATTAEVGASGLWLSRLLQAFAMAHPWDPIPRPAGIPRQV